VVALNAETKSLADLPNRESEDGWTPLEFYAFIIRSVGIPARFYLDGGEWAAEAPFTKPSAKTLALLEANGV
jgi:hypothetical protein